ncbi:MAG: hypothetical protein ACPG49_11150 [Chitinophagales bacterium]
MKNLILFIGLSLAMFSFSSCDKDDPEPPHEEELITTLTLTMTPEAGGNDVVFQFRDTDGEGGNDAVITSGALMANTVYNGVIELLNESISPTEDITAEVKSEGTEHQFFFATTEGVNLSFGYRDMDTDGNPIGLEAAFQTGDASSGQFQVTLRHEPTKNASNVSAGDISNAGGETDIEVIFDIDIQ